MPVNQGQTVAMAWESYVGKSPEDQYHEDYWLFKKFSAGKGFKGVDGGRDIRVHLEYAANTTVRSYSDTEQLDTTRVDVFDEANYNWKETAGTVTISELEKAKNQGSGGKFPLLAAKLESLKKSLRKSLNEQMFSDGTGNSSKDIGGLQYLISSTPTTGTVGGISRSTYSFWRNQQTSGAQTASDFDNLRSAFRTIDGLCRLGVADSEGEAFWVSTLTVLNGYESLLVANERYEGDKGTGDGFFKQPNLKVRGNDFVYDNDCPSATAYRLNTAFLKLAYQRNHWMKMSEPVDPANQTVDIYKVHSIQNLIASQPRRLGVVTAIS